MWEVQVSSPAGTKPIKKGRKKKRSTASRQQTWALKPQRHPWGSSGNGMGGDVRGSRFKSSRDQTPKKESGKKSGTTTSVQQTYALKLCCINCLYSSNSKQTPHLLQTSTTQQNKTKWRMRFSSVQSKCDVASEKKKKKRMKKIGNSHTLRYKMRIFSSHLATCKQRIYFIQCFGSRINRYPT